ncbi:MAG TPA: PDZ domain-containing protein [Chthoniobacteraceae bacterium]|jgi:hypothetical protein|nr:PDZ domain-containing protein [Chthoniobacteraceae bacterium]
MLRSIPILTVFLGLAILPSRGAEIFVSPQGLDSNPGTASQPFHSFLAAQLAARKLAVREPVRVTFADGIYYLPEAVHLTSQDSGITFAAAREGGAVISGGMEIKLKWQPYRDGIQKAVLSDAALQAIGGASIDQLYINGQRQRMARYPNARPGKAVFDTWDLGNAHSPDPADNPLDPARIARWSDPAGGYLHAMHPALWGDVHWLITGKKPDGTLALQGGWQNNRGSGMHRTFRYVENIFEELDAPGEWYYKTAEHTLYFEPEAGVDLATAKVEVVRLRTLVEADGAAQAPVRNVVLRGFIFRHAARTFMETREPLLRSDWRVYRGGALFFTGSEDCRIEDCTFDQLGGNSIFVNCYNRRLLISGCLIKDGGASGILFVGDPKAVRSPLFNYDQRRDYKTLDLTPGPLTNNYPAQCTVEDCLITHTGRFEKQTAGIQIAMSQGITVRHCSIYNVPRAGINIDEGTWGGHVIEYCDVFDTVEETGDHGSFNSWGRDRYWNPNTRTTAQAVAADPALPFLDAQTPNIIRYNRWRCDHGWDVDLDDGSTNYIITCNLLLNRGLKLREGYRRIVTNNVIVNCSLCPHVWFPNSGDVFAHNIVMGAYRPDEMTANIPPDGKWGLQIDYNLFTTSESDRTKFAKNGADAHSVVGNPEFIDPEHGNYDVKPGSPALTEIGFRNFPMNQFGVTKPELKAIAETPKLPGITRGIAQKTEPLYLWLGATVKDLGGDDFSAVGVAEGSPGVLVTEAPAGSQAAKEGLREGDFIQQCAGRPVANVAAFIRILKGKSNAPVPLIILRNQTEHANVTLPASTALPGKQSGGARAM